MNKSRINHYFYGLYILYDMNLLKKTLHSNMNWVCLKVTKLIEGIIEGIIEQYQSPDYSPDELKQSLHGLGIGTGIFFKKIPRQNSFDVENYGYHSHQTCSCLWLQPGWKTAHGPGGWPALFSNTSSALPWCSPVLAGVSHPGTGSVVFSKSREEG